MRPQRLVGDRCEVDRFALVEPALSLGEHEQSVDQLLLLLALLERLPARFPESLGRRRRVGDDHLEQRAGRRQRRAELMGGVGNEAPLGIQRLLQRTQHAPGDEPTEAARDDDHDRQRDRRLKLELVQVGDPLLDAGELDSGSAGGRRQDAPDPRGYVRRRDAGTLGARRHAGLPRRTAPVPRGELGTAERGVRNEGVGDGEEPGTAGEEEAAVEQREAPADRRLGPPRPDPKHPAALEARHRPSPIR
jgi:hypothetical protein